MKEIILASASPRRYELLKQLGISFKVFPSNIVEKTEFDLNAEEVAQELSFMKAMDVVKQLNENIGHTGSITDRPLVIGADTIVVKDLILGKPKDEMEAYKMLKALEGGWHEVITGITVIDSSDNKYIKFFEKTRVKMKRLDDRIINSYIKTREPMDKAGAYGIQGVGAVLVERIEGCYFNVVGLPLMRLATVLEKFGVSVL